MHEIWIVHEDDKLRRPNARLRHKENLKRFTFVRRRWINRNGVLNEIIQCAGLNPHGLLLRHILHQICHAGNPLFCQRRNIEYRGILQKSDLISKIIGKP